MSFLTKVITTVFGNKSEKEIEASDNSLDDCEEFLKLQEDWSLQKLVH